MPEIYYVDARGERVADGDPRAAYVINPADPGAAALLERLRREQDSAVARGIEGIKATRPAVRQASEKHKGAVDRLHRIAAENRRKRGMATAEATAVAEAAGTARDGRDERTADGTDGTDGHETNATAETDGPMTTTATAGERAAGGKKASRKHHA